MINGYNVNHIKAEPLTAQVNSGSEKSADSTKLDSQSFYLQQLLTGEAEIEAEEADENSEILAAADTGISRKKWHDCREIRRKHFDELMSGNFFKGHIKQENTPNLSVSSEQESLQNADTPEEQTDAAEKETAPQQLNKTASAVQEEKQQDIDSRLAALYKKFNIDVPDMVTVFEPGIVKPKPIDRQEAAGVSNKKIGAASNAGNINYEKQIKKGNSLNTKYDNIILKYSKMFGADPLLIKCIIQHESSFKLGAKSNKGAMGLMQMIPSTARMMGVKKPYDPEDNLRGGIKYFSEMMQKFNNNVPLALAAYNAGPQRVIDSGYRVPGASKKYVNNITNMYNKLNSRN